MMKIKDSLMIIAMLYLSACNSNAEKEQCDFKNFNDLELTPVKVKIKLPSYTITDSLIYGDGRTILNYKISSKDSLLNAVIFVDDYGKTYNRELSITQQLKTQKQEVEFGRDKIMLLKEDIKNFDSIKVGYLKYFIDQGKQKFYEARLFFYKDKKLFVCWLYETYKEEKLNSFSIIDCIEESIEFK